MNQQEARLAICAEAVSWERTPYHDGARIKGVGADCAQFPIGVYVACGLIPDMRPVYSSQWMHHRDEELYLAEIRRYAREIPESQLQPGDLMIWRFGRVYSHSAIVLDPPLVIHASATSRCIARADYTQEEDLKAAHRPRLAFSLFEADGSRVPFREAIEPEGELVPLNPADPEAGYMAKPDFEDHA